jgi:hypothetical protein
MADVGENKHAGFEDPRKTAIPSEEAGQDAVHIAVVDKVYRYAIEQATL